MIVKHFKLSQPEKDRLIRIKAKTGIQNWNVLCRWALCWSLSEPSIPVASIRYLTVMLKWIGLPLPESIPKSTKQSSDSGASTMTWR